MGVAEIGKRGVKETQLLREIRRVASSATPDEGKYRK